MINNIRNANIRTISVSGSGEKVEIAAGRFFTVISCTAGFTVAPDDGTRLPMSTGRGFGDSQSSGFSRLVFRDTSGATNTISFYAGDEPFRVPETTSVELSTSSATAITPAAATVTTGFAAITGNTNYTGKKTITVLCYSGTVTVQGTTLPVGVAVSFETQRMQDTLDTIAVTVSGGTAYVSWTA